MKRVGALTVEYSLPHYALCRVRLSIFYAKRHGGRKVSPFRVFCRSTSGRAGSWILVVNKDSDAWEEEVTDEIVEKVLKSFGVKGFQLKRWSVDSEHTTLAF